jgi:uncharacterized protein YbaA (DUF1428 family)
MSKSDKEGVDKEVGSQVQLVIYRLPKKNHDAMVQICKQSMFRRYGVLHYEIFQLDNTKSFGEMGMTNIYHTISAAQDEEVWLEFVYYRDRKHMEEVITKMERDEDMGRLYKQSFDLITPGTSFILGEFNRMKISGL